MNESKSTVHRVGARTGQVGIAGVFAIPAYFGTYSPIVRVKLIAAGVIETVGHTDSKASLNIIVEIRAALHCERNEIWLTRVG
jgi:hypothetical protein